MCQIYSKVTIKTPESCLVLLLLTLNIFCTLLILSGGNTEIFLGNTSMKCDHDCDQALIKSSWGSVLSIYISEFILWLHQGKFANIKWEKIPSLAALQVAKYMRTVKQCECTQAFKGTLTDI